MYSATSGVSLLCGKLTHNPNQEATLSILFSKEKFTEITAYEWWEKNKERFINELHHTVIPTSELIKRDSVIKYIEESKDPSKPILVYILLQLLIFRLLIGFILMKIQMVQDIN